MCKKEELAPLSVRDRDGALHSLRGYYYCRACDVMFRMEYRPVTVKS